MQAQCWICPHCHDDKHHEQCDPEELKRELEQARDALTVSIAARKKLAQEVAEARQEVEREREERNHLSEAVTYWRQQLAAREAELTGIKEANSQLAGAAVERPPYKADLLAELARVKQDAARWKAIETANGELTLRLHSARPDQRVRIVDDALTPPEQEKNSDR